MGWASLWTPPTLAFVSVVSRPDEPTGLTVDLPDDALKRAQPLPSDDEMAITDLADEEWRAFQQAPADR
jgi:hypothetical protein